MALVLAGDEVLPITIPEALHSVTKMIVDIVRKNRTLVDYYIYPKETPSEIEAYLPRLQALYARVEALSALDLDKLTLVADNAAALVSAFVLPIVDQLLNAVYGVQQIFINHYDRDLEKRKPYATIYNTLEYRERQLKRFQSDQMQNPQRRLPESLVMIPAPGSDPSFCRFAVAFTNHRDHGKLSQVLSEDLSSEDKDRLRNHGGAYLSWDCPGCAFKLKYHVASSITANILATDDVRSHSDVPEIEYRPSWLVKCHLYQMKSQDSDQSTIFSSRRGSVSAMSTDTKRIPAVRRQSDARSIRSSSFFWGAPRRSKSEIVTERSSNLRTKESKLSVSKYGCPFCFVTGKEYGHMDYKHGHELAEHIAARHSYNRPPSSLMLERYMVGLDGRCAENVRRWDLNIKLK